MQIDGSNINITTTKKYQKTSLYRTKTESDNFDMASMLRQYSKKISKSPKPVVENNQSIMQLMNNLLEKDTATHTSEVSSGNSANPKLADSNTSKEKQINVSQNNQDESQTGNNKTQTNVPAQNSNVSLKGVLFTGSGINSKANTLNSETFQKFLKTNATQQNSSTISNGSGENYKFGSSDITTIIDNSRFKSNISEGGIGYAKQQTYFADTRQKLDKISNSNLMKNTKKVSEKLFKPFSKIDKKFDKVAQNVADNMSKHLGNSEKMLANKFNKASLNMLKKAGVVETKTVTTLKGEKINLTLAKSKWAKTVSTIARSEKTAALTKGLGRAATVVAVADGVWDTGKAYTEKGTIAGAETAIKNTTAIASGIVGAKIGAAVGSAFVPPVGTIVGGVAGGAVGYIAGSEVGKTIGKAAGKTLKATKELMAKSPTGKKVLDAAQKGSDMTKKVVKKGMDSVRKAWNGTKQVANKTVNVAKQVAKAHVAVTKKVANVAQKTVKVATQAAKSVAQKTAGVVKAGYKTVKGWFS